MASQVGTPVSGTDVSGVTSVSSPQKTNSAGNLLISVVKIETAGRTFSGVTDLAGNTWTIINQADYPGTPAARHGFAYAKNCAAYTNNVVTWAISGGFADFCSCSMDEWSGIDTTSPLDGSFATGTGSTKPWTTSNISTNGSGLVYIGVSLFNAYSALSGTPGVPDFTANTLVAEVATGYLISASSQTVTPGLTATGADDNWYATAQSFKDAGAFITETLAAVDSVVGIGPVRDALIESMIGADLVSASGGTNVPRMTLHRRYPRRQKYGVPFNTKGWDESKNYGPIGARLLYGYADPDTQTLAGSQSESGSLADSVQGVGPTAASAAESGALSDQPSGTATAIASASESGAATDAPSGATSTASSQSEAGAATDAPVATASASATIAEAGTGVDTSSAISAALASIAEAGTASDAPAGAQVAIAQVVEAGSAADASTGTTGAQTGTVNEVGTAAESASGVATAPASAQESVSASESATGTMQAVASASESASATDAQDATGGNSVSIAEAGSAQDSPSATSTQVGTAAESGTASDAPSAVRTTQATTPESGSAADSPSAGTATPAAQVESGTASDSSTGIGGNLGSVAESLNAVDSSSAVKVALATLGESASAVDLCAAWYTVLSAVAELRAIADAVDAVVVGPGGPYRDPRFWLTHDPSVGASRYAGDGQVIHDGTKSATSRTRNTGAKR